MRGEFWHVIANAVHKTSSLMAQGGFYEWHWEMHPIWWWGWGMGMMAMMVLFWVIFLVGLVAAIRWLLSKRTEAKTDPALQILRERYARGEINKEEFEIRKKDLGG
jgi:putative membrane protein